MTDAYDHIPVLGNEIVEAFRFDRPVYVVDGTLGLGGHSEMLLTRYPQMSILGLDWDKDAVQTARERLARFGDRFEAQEASYTDLPSILSQRGRETVDGLLLDLGLSSRQLQDSTRGFSFLRPGPLDMRMSQSLTQTAWQLLHQASETELARLFKAYGEEMQARKIAQLLKDAIKRNVLVNDAWQVAELIRKSSYSPMHRIDPATRCFQALRIAVNHELDNIDRVLGCLKGSLASGGRAAIISFHSLEDRRVKTIFQGAVRGCVCPPRFPACVCGQVSWGKMLHRKVIVAGEEEVQRNPRARSAKLRILERV